MTDLDPNSGVPASAPGTQVDLTQIGRVLREPLDHAIAAGARKALELGVPAHDVVGMFLNHLASVIAMVEPPGARQGLIGDVVRQLAPMVERHWEARQRTAGGVWLPKAGNGVHGTAPASATPTDASHAP